MIVSLCGEMKISRMLTGCVCNGEPRESFCFVCLPFSFVREWRF